MKVMAPGTSGTKSAAWSGPSSAANTGYRETHLDIETHIPIVVAELLLPEFGLQGS